MKTATRDNKVYLSQVNGGGRNYRHSSPQVKGQSGWWVKGQSGCGWWVNQVMSTVYKSCFNHIKIPMGDAGGGPSTMFNLR